MKKILFLIHDLGQGGAEKVLVNLVNNLDRTKFEISVTALFGGGVNEQFLAPDIKFRTVFPRAVPGNSKLMKLLTPKQLHKLCVREVYDIEVSYLEGPDARIISGCPQSKTKLVAWIHTAFQRADDAKASFRSKAEANSCYNCFNRIIAVSETAKVRFQEIFLETPPVEVLYNTLESEKIMEQAREALPDFPAVKSEISLCAIGSLKPVKGFDRLLRVHKRLRDAGIAVHTYILGQGPDKAVLQEQVQRQGIDNSVSFLGYQTNPYKYVSKCDLFVCSSHTEGFSTAATEALIVGTPVCTVEVSGMKEMLGENNEYGVVTDNNEDALYQGIYEILTVPGRLEHYKKQAALRGRDFSTEETVRAVEDMLLSL